MSTRQRGMRSAAVELDDIQGLVRFGYKHHTEASFLLLRVTDRDAARRWLAAVPVMHRGDGRAAARHRAADRAHRRGHARPRRRRRDRRRVLRRVRRRHGGRREPRAPARRRRRQRPEPLAMGRRRRACRTCWCCSTRCPGRLAGFQSAIEAQCAAGFEQMDVPRRRATSTASSRSASWTASRSRSLDWQRKRAATDAERSDYSNLSCLGEYLLGYPNEYGGYTDRPLLDPARAGPRAAARRGRARPRRPRPQRQLPRHAPAAPGRARLLAVRRPPGRRRRRRCASGSPSAMVGRTPRRRSAGRPGRRGDRRRRRSRRPERLHLPLRPARPALPARRAHPAQQSAQRRPAAGRAGHRLVADAHARLRRRSARARPGRVDALSPPAAPRPRVRRRRVAGSRRSASPPASAETGPALHLPGRQHRAPVRVRAERLGDGRQLRRPAERKRSAARHARAGAPTARRPTASRCRAPTAPPSASPACRSSSPCSAAPTSSCPASAPCASWPRTQ